MNGPPYWFFTSEEVKSVDSRSWQEPQESYESIAGKLSLFVTVIVLLTGLAYARNMIWKDGITLFQDAAAKSPGKARPHYNLGELLEKQDRLREAAAEYRQALLLDPYLSEAYNNLGVIYFSQGLTDIAIWHYRAALQRDPANAKAHNNLGNALRKKGFIEEAAQEFRNALAINPRAAEPKFNLNNIYLPRETKSDLAELRLRKGRFYAGQGLFSRAINEYLAALSYDPQRAEIYNDLGTAYSDLGEIDNARSAYKSALQLDPASDVALRNLMALEQKGKQTSHP